ncbi:BamA/TamA family outer membrane protein [Marseilla massiliensis]|uniref:BamA/TamA family outer membrane protein n=2 Tax=Marseilla massiliensis TaxID=1841864 RepID=A0A938WVQ6_9BACT|nr:BamA/TamA family outer membrane protein [Marseilla massiliensis]
MVICALLFALILSSCSTTKNIPKNDQLFIGLTKIEYNNYDNEKENTDHFTSTKEEIEASLATAPNGALFGSSYYRTPFPYGLWIWNAFSGSKNKIAQWITKTFGKAPVLMRQVNPELRASVAQSVLRNHGYLNGTVSYQIVPQKNPKKAKIGYTVNFGRLFTVDSLEYVDFPQMADSLINLTKNDALIKSGSPLDASIMDAERTRLSTLFRNNGYYFYQPNFASYLADTTAVTGKAKLRLQMASNLPAITRRKWYIGNIRIDIRKQFMEELKDSFSHRYFTVRFNGKRPPIRPRIILADLRLRPRQQFSYDRYIESSNKINGSGLFSSVEFNFTPRDTTGRSDTLDLNLSCTFGKPYDFYIETNYKNKINGRHGPELVIGFTKRNAFRGGEKLDINLHGSYEWEQGGNVNGSGGNMNSYEYGADASIEFPRLVVPFLKRRRYFTTPSTYAKISMNVLNRPDYFKMHTFSAEWTYKWQRSDKLRHEFSPLTLQYQKLNRTTAKFDSILYANPYLQTSMQDVFIPKIRYTLTYSSAMRSRNPLVWETTFTEAGNILSLGYMAAGDKWSQTDKQLFSNPYAQFLKLETDISKTWQLGEKSQLVAHANAGIIYTYGNSSAAPYSEQFYVGGANSIRAFAVRSIGPGSYTTDVSRLSYLDQTGDIKLQLNLEYRFNIFGSLYGAGFIDAGNVWALRDDGYRKGSQFKFKNALKEMALGTGIGIRYDLEFLVLRLDWGVGLHVPYETGKSGFYNIPNFKDGQAIHLAIGYPF